VPSSDGLAWAVFRELQHVAGPTIWILDAEHLAEGHLLERQRHLGTLAEQVPRSRLSHHDLHAARARAIAHATAADPTAPRAHCSATARVHGRCHFCCALRSRTQSHASGMFARPLAGVSITGHGVDPVSPQETREIADDGLRRKRRPHFSYGIENQAIRLTMRDGQRHAVGALVRGPRV
jgi:hypothetical protein